MKSHVDRNARDPLDLGWSQQFGLGQELQPIERHAIDATQIAIVDYRYSQVINLSIKGIARHYFGSRRTAPSTSISQFYLPASRSFNIAPVCANCA